MVIIGPPGSGKSTFLEWLNLQLAGAELEFPQGDQQAIPLLLRVRQLDPSNAPLGSGLIAAATEGRDRAERMPEGWIERQMAAGRVVLMLDGLDETDPEVRDQYLLPWLENLCIRYSDCRFIVSSRPVGYPPRRLAKLGFREVEVCDFTPDQMKQYSTNWCTAIRLARNEPEQEAKTEGEKEGAQIVASFEAHDHIADLARTPLMLSAICLVNYFEGKQLPQDRALLYRLCVEGLLHHWDQRRGITSDFSLSDKLRVCREVAIAMQADALAELSESIVTQTFKRILGSSEMGDRLLQHIRYRTGIIIERRPGMFAFAHLTFQEYLAACAILEGNHCHVDAKKIVQEHVDGKWNEVIALYCGIAPAPLARSMLEDLITCRGTTQLSRLLSDGYFAAGKNLMPDASLRGRIIDRISKCPAFYPVVLELFQEEDVASSANKNLGFGDNPGSMSESFRWLQAHSDFYDRARAMAKIINSGDCAFLAEVTFMSHYAGGEEEFVLFEKNPLLYALPGFPSATVASCQGEIALIAIAGREKLELFMLNAVNGVWRALAHKKKFGKEMSFAASRFIKLFDSQLREYVYKLSPDVVTVLRKLGPERGASYRVASLDSGPLKILYRAFAARVDETHRSGRDPGWPHDLPSPVRRFLEEPNG